MAGGEPRPSQMPVKFNTRHTQGVSGQTSSFKSTAGSLLASSHKTTMVSKQIPLQPKCIYCSQGHWSDECTKFTTLQARKERVKNSCFKCLQKGHMLKDCRHNRQCAHCGRQSHHRSLFPQLFRNGDQSLIVLPQGQNVASTEAQTVSSVVDKEKVMLTSTKQVLMQTATSTIKNIPGDVSLTVCMILD